MRRHSPPALRIIAPPAVAAALVLLALLSALPVRAGAADCSALGPLEAEQQLRLTHFGSEAGEEHYRISRSPAGDSLVVTATAKGTLPGRTYSMRMRLVVDPADYSLLRYRLDAVVAGENQIVQAWRAADSVIVAIETPQGRVRRGFAEPGPVHIADNLVGSHLVLIACRAMSPPPAESARRDPTRSDPAQHDSAGRDPARRDPTRPDTLRLIVPQVGAVVPAYLSALSSPFPDGTRTIDFTISTLRETISIDAAGAFHSVDIPSQSLRYFSPALSDASKKMPIAKGPERPPVEMAPEAQARPTRILFEEEVVRFVSGTANLPGIMTLPRGGQAIPYPTVIFLPGSGHQDRDNAIGPNRPFYDIARGLAVQGIASFRFDKRSLVEPKSIDPVRGTAKEDLIDDALAAIDFVRSRGDVDGKRIILLGYELGGALAAEIANADGRVAAIVVFSSSPRPLDERMRDEILLMKRSGRTDGTGEMTDRFLRQLDSLVAGTLPPQRQLMGIRAGYLADLRTRDLAGAYQRFRGPVLVLRGGKNHLEFPTDAKIWSEIAERRGKRVTEVRDYPNLGPLLIHVHGEPGPGTFFESGMVDPIAIDDIAGFIGRVR